MLVEMKYTEWAELFGYGKVMLEEFTPETLSNIDNYFDEFEDPISCFSELNPKNFYLNIISLLDEGDLWEYGFTSTQVKVAYENSTHNAMPWMHGVCTLNALKQTNQEAYWNLIEKHEAIFGWTKDRRLVVISK